MNVKNVEIRNFYQMYPDFKIDVEAADSYQEGGHNGFTIEELLKPLEQTINLAGMKFNKALVSHDMVYIPDVCNNKEEVEQRARAHASKLLQFINETVSNEEQLLEKL